MKGLAVLIVVAAPVAAQEPLLGFADCMDAEAARYERLLAPRHVRRDGGGYRRCARRGLVRRRGYHSL